MKTGGLEMMTRLQSKSVLRPFLYSCPTSFGQKYGHFNFLCKQMSIFSGKIYIFRKVSSVPTFLGYFNTWQCDVYPMRRVLKIYCRSTCYEICCIKCHFGEMLFQPSVILVKCLLAKCRAAYFSSLFFYLKSFYIWLWHWIRFKHIFLLFFLYFLTSFYHSVFSFLFVSDMFMIIRILNGFVRYWLKILSWG